MSLVRFINHYGSYLILFSILENILVIFLIIETFIYYKKYKTIDKKINDTLEKFKER